MALAVILFAGFIGIALVAVLSVLAFIDVAFNVWDSADRAHRVAQYVDRASQPRTAEMSPPIQPVQAHSWVQSA